MVMRTKHLHIFTAGIITFLIIFSGFASANPFVLGIYGNANMDDVINNKDLGYIHGVIKGSLHETHYSDANHDGRINNADIQQIKDLISGTAKEVIIEDCNRNTITVKRPENNIIALHAYEVWIANILGKKHNQVKDCKTVPSKNDPRTYDSGTVHDFNFDNKWNIKSALQLNPDIMPHVTRDRWKPDCVDHLVKHGHDPCFQSVIPYNKVDVLNNMRKTSFVIGPSPKWNDMDLS